MKNRGLPCAVPFTTKPGENPTTRRNRSPLTSPSESAYVAPSENPPIAIRAGSTDTSSKTRSRARSTNVTSAPKPPRMPSQLEPRESGARTATPASSAAAPRRRSMPSPLPPAPWSRTSSGSGAAGAFAGSRRIASRAPPSPSRSPFADVLTFARGRAASLPSFAPPAPLKRCPASEPSLRRHALPNANDEKMRPAISPNRRRLIRIWVSYFVLRTSDFRLSLLRHQPQYLPSRAIRHHVERAVRTFADAADPGVELGQQPLLADDPLVLQHEPNEPSPDQRRHEQIALPRRKKLPHVEADARWCDVGRPELNGLLHALLRRPVVVDRLSRVLASVADRGKAVVPALLDHVDLVAASRPVLARPQPAGAWMNRHALHVSEAERVNLGMHAAGAAGKGVVLRDRSVRIDPQHFAHVAVELLRLRPVDGVDADARGNRGRDEQRTVRRLNQPSADAFGVQQHLEILEPLVVG